MPNGAASEDADSSIRALLNLYSQATPCFDPFEMMIQYPYEPAIYPNPHFSSLTRPHGVGV